MAKLETIKPIKVFETSKLLAKIGIAGMITPKPTATKIPRLRGEVLQMVIWGVST